MQVGNYSISNTRDATHRKPGEAPMHRLRVRLHGKMLAEVYPALCDPDRIGHSNPLKFCQQYPQSKSCKSLIEQLRLNGTPEDDIVELLRMDNKGNA